jgi:WD40 repeat protein
MIWEAHTGGITSVCCSPDGRWIVTGSEDTTVKIWDIGAAIDDRLGS